MEVEIWNNASCSKCAAARSTLDAARVPYRLRAYVEQPPTVAELAEVLRRLNAQPWEICRTDEAAARRLRMYEWPRDPGSAGRWIAAMVEHPELIQRPILRLDDGDAVVARTPEALDEVVRRSDRP
jgi:arsenate reductase (glutaredoxin)